MNLKLCICLSALILLVSCQKKTTFTNPQQNDHFKVTFDNYWAPGEQGVAIFLSDMSGNLLAEQLLHGQSEVTLLPQTTIVFPDRMIETLVYTGPSNGSQITVYFYSYYNINPADWIYRSFQNVPVGNGTFHFTNIPKNSQYSLSDYYEWTYGDLTFGSSDTLQSQYTLALNRDPDNCYVWLSTLAGDYQYKWIQGITSGGSYQVDLSSMDFPVTKLLSFDNVSYYACRLSGYLPAGEHSSGLYTIDYSHYSGPDVNNLLLHYPLSLFTDYELYIYYRDQSEPRKEWYNYTFGSIPSTISKISGDIQILDSTVNNFHIQVTGDCDRLASNWVYNPTGTATYRYEWHAYSSSAMTTLVLPSLPSDVAGNFQGFTKDSLKLSNVEIKDFNDIYSYDDYVQRVFVSGNYIANITGRYSGLTCSPHAIPANTKESPR